MLAWVVANEAQIAPIYCLPSHKPIPDSIARHILSGQDYPSEVNMNTRELHCIQYTQRRIVRIYSLSSFLVSSTTFDAFVFVAKNKQSRYSRVLEGGYDIVCVCIWISFQIHSNYKNTICYPVHLASEQHQYRGIAWFVYKRFFELEEWVELSSKAYMLAEHIKAAFMNWCLYMYMKANIIWKMKCFF